MARGHAPLEIGHASGRQCGLNLVERTGNGAGRGGARGCQGLPLIRRDPLKLGHSTCKASPLGCFSLCQGQPSPGVPGAEESG